MISVHAQQARMTDYHMPPLVEHVGTSGRAFSVVPAGRPLVQYIFCCRRDARRGRLVIDAPLKRQSRRRGATVQRARIGQWRRLPPLLRHSMAAELTSMAYRRSSGVACASLYSCLSLIGNIFHQPPATVRCRPCRWAPCRSSPCYLLSSAPADLNIVVQPLWQPANDPA